MSLLPVLLVISLWLWPLPVALSAKLPAVLILFGLSQFHQWSRLSSGSVFAPEFPRPLVLAFNWGFAAIPMLAVLMLGIEAVAAIVSLAQGAWCGIPASVRLGAGALVSILCALGVRNAVRVPPLRDEVVALPGLPPAFEGYRLLHLTDLHLGRLFPRRWAEQVVARANTAGADLIVVTGDFIDGSVEMRRADIAPLRDLRAPDGVLGIPGNHEYFFDYAAWMRHLSGLGIRMLPNAHVAIARGTERLVVAGVTDLSAARHGEAAPDLGAALRGAPPATPVILLDHQPGHARRRAAQGVSLQLSGHTHGGMMPGLARMVARGNDGFVSGRYAVDGMTLIVGNGTGIWPGFALRLFCPSEMIRITLRAG
ncbi:metallophosphoesterase [Acetobacteraceae bacterium KSS8]|uniref:Metallophosphoesterase n=1 Tax=Endosaccharibacter trunci TaxID=2812733 RepID=A0ABT1W9E9_9PROT|nr:metallophosphoesterase [Acetobacteraceae bacterium KSS8]